MFMTDDDDTLHVCFGPDYLPARDNIAYMTLAIAELYSWREVCVRIVLVCI